MDLLGDQSCYSEGFCILISSKKSPKFTPRSYFQNSKWPPSAILDFQIYIKVMNFTSPYEQKYFHDIFPTNFALLYQIFLNFDSYPCSSGSHLVFAQRSFFCKNSIRKCLGIHLEFLCKRKKFYDHLYYFYTTPIDYV